MDSVNIATLKSKLSEYLRRVRNGVPVIVLDRRSPIARIVPYDSEADSLPSRKPEGALSDFKAPDTSLCSSSSLEILLEQRQSHR